MMDFMIQSKVPTTAIVSAVYKPLIIHSRSFFVFNSLVRNVSWEEAVVALGGVALNSF